MIDQSATLAEVQAVASEVTVAERRLRRLLPVLGQRGVDAFRAHAEDMAAALATVRRQALALHGAIEAHPLESTTFEGGR